MHDLKGYRAVGERDEFHLLCTFKGTNQIHSTWSFRRAGMQFPFAFCIAPIFSIQRSAQTVVNDALLCVCVGGDNLYLEMCALS